MKILCFGVKEDVEQPIFEKINEKFNYELNCVPYLLNHENVDLVSGYDALILRGNCIADAKNLEIIKNKYNIKYVLTRTAGYNHIDLEAAKKLGIKVAYVPVYSPNAISELALSLALNLSRHALYSCYRSSKLNFTTDSYMFSKEIRNSIVGIIGLGNIGLTTAKLFNGLGAKILGSDIIQKNIDYIEQVTTEQLASRSDIIILHCPYIPGVNENIINEDLINKMKSGVIIVNVARGELHDIKSIIKNVKSGKIHGFATDVLSNETHTFDKTFNQSSDLDEDVKQLIDLYPKVLITPHIGPYTDEAVINMIEYSFENLDNLVKGIKSPKILV